MRPTRLTALLIATAALAAAAAPAQAEGPFGPLNDLAALGQGGGQTPDTVPAVKRPAPPIEATPAPSHCDPGAHPQPSVDGRVPADSATNGLWCNVTLISHQGTSGGFKVLRYVDAQGHECAYYDTALLFPLNAFNLNSNGIGVVVLDMSDPAHPKQTAVLTDPAMLSPHESLNLNVQRGLLAAVDGNPSTYPGYVSIYDVSKDCRFPVHDFGGVLARFGHESGFAPDGRTFYATGTAVKAITAIDVSDPTNPHVVWHGNVQSHGMSLSDDGNRAYIADPTGRNMLILDTSQIQARKPDPQAREISRLTWDKVSIPQNAIPFTQNGHPYVLEFDEYNASTLNPSGDPNDVGAGRIIDIADERAPRIVSYLRLQIDQPKEHAQYGGDPGAQGQQNGGPQGYAAHYCGIPTRVDPQLVACSFIASGLRIFDISDLVHPKEIGYFVAPTQAKIENGYNASDFSMSQPAFAPDRHEIWFSDGPTGFYALHVADDAWPKGAVEGCQTRSSLTLKLRLPRGTRVRSIHALLAGRRLQIERLRNGRRTARVRIAVPARLTGTLVVRARLSNGRIVTQRRPYATC